jgi:hypothetical protein
MKFVLYCALSLAVLVAIAFPTVPAQAQTTAPGPYYATPSWDQKLQCDTKATCPRFIVLSNWNNEAVLDRETGLVWERSPSRTGFPWSSTVTISAKRHCNELNVGNRHGWKLPTIQELASLLELPAGHPFTNLGSFYWSATTDADFPDSAWYVAFGFGAVLSTEKIAPWLAWCVRGGQGVDPQ